MGCLVELAVAALALSLAVNDVGVAWALPLFVLAYLYSFGVNLGWRWILGKVKCELPDGLVGVAFFVAVSLIFTVLPAIPYLLAQVIPGQASNAIFNLALAYGTIKGIFFR